MFVRFITETSTENPFYMPGPFAAGRDDQFRKQLEPHDVAWHEELIDWFNDHLPVPPFRHSLECNSWSYNAVCWFKDHAKEPLRRMWELAALLEKYNLRIRFLRTRHPGSIVYEDDYQIVAETPPLRDQDRRILPRRLARYAARRWPRRR